MILILDLVFLSFFSSHEEERLYPINSFLEGLFDSSEQLSVPNCAKPELLESFFDDVFLNESRTVSAFDHESRDTTEEETQACKSLATYKVHKPICLVSFIL